MASRRIAVSLVSYPPTRYTGAELYTHALCKALKVRGHRVTVYALNVEACGSYEGIPVMGDGDFPESADLLIQHADFAIDARVRRLGNAPIVLIAHNARDGVQDGVRMTRHDFLAATSQATASALPAVLGARVYAPPQPAVRRLSGGRVTLVNCNEDKGGGIVSALAERMLDVPFLMVAGGYGRQYVPDLPNVMRVPAVRPGEMDDRVWRFTRLCLMPSLHESWGSVASEAMSRGIPVIASTTPGLIENLGATGVFVHNRGDLSAWEVAIRAAIAAPRWAQLSASATARADRPDGIARLADDLTDLMDWRADETAPDRLLDIL